MAMGGESHTSPQQFLFTIFNKKSPFTLRITPSKVIWFY